MRRFRVALHREAALLLAPAALFAVWLGLLLATFGSVVHVVYTNGDVVSAPVVGELFSERASGATTVLGYLSWYSTLWFELATRWLPFHRELWEVTPWLASLAGIGVVAWATAKAAGRWAGWIVAVVLACAGDRLLAIQLAGGPYHGVTAFSVCVLDGFLVLLVLRGGRIGGRVAHSALCVAAAVIAASALASDAAFIPAGLVPFAVAGVAQLRWATGAPGRRTAASALGVAVGAVALARVAVAAMHATHTYAARTTIAFADWDSLGRNVDRLLQSLADLFNGDFGGAAIGARSSLAFACALALACAAVAAVGVGREQVRRLQAPRPAASTAVRDAHVLFWVAALVCTAVAFVFSSFAELDGGRYVVAGGYGLLVLAAVGASSRGSVARAAAAAGACILVSGSVVALAAGDIRHNPGHYPQQDVADFLATAAQGEHLGVGYASYWDAAALTWQTSEHVRVYPVVPCAAPSALCTYPLHEISSWYAARPGIRSFLLVDPRYGPGPPAGALGAPAETLHYGEYAVYVFDYDIAAKLGNWQRYGADAA